MAGFATLGEIQAQLKLEGLSTFTKDLKSADKQLGTFSKKMTAAGKSMTATGKTLTKNVSLPILGVGAAALKLAADFEVSSNKFAGAFAGSAEAAAESVEMLSEEFGLAESQATSLLANTGDLLKGFGATADEALNLSTEVQKLSVQLAAANGKSVVEASRAVTSALLGETEQLKGLSVVIKDADIQQELLRTGQEDLEGQAYLLAKANATLDLALRQSSDAISGFADNQDTLKYKTGELTGKLHDAAVEIGTIFVPIAKRVVEVLKDAVDWFSELTDEQKKLIVITAGVVAAIGPAVIAIGLATTAVGYLSAALAFLVANPIVAAVAGIALVTGAVVALVKIGKEKQLEELTEQFGELGEKVGVTGKDLDLFVRKAAEVENQLAANDMYVTFESVNRQMVELIKNTGLTKEEIISIGQQSDRLSDTFKEQLDIMAAELAMDKLRKEEVKELVDLKKSDADLDRAARMAAVELLKAAEEQAIVDKEANRIEAERIKKLLEKEQIEARLKALYDYEDEREAAQIRFNLGLSTQRELLEENLAAAETQSAALIAAGYDGADATSYGNRELIKMADTINDLNLVIDYYDDHTTEAMKATADEAAKATKALEDQDRETMEAIAAINDEYHQKLLTQRQDKFELLMLEKEDALLNALETGADLALIRQYYDEEERILDDEQELADQERRDREIAAEQAKYFAIANLARGFMSQLLAIQNQQVENKKAAVAKFDDLNMSEIESLEAKAKLEAGLTEDEKKRLADLQLERTKLLDEQYKQEVKAFKIQQSLSIADTIISGAQAAVSAFGALAGIPVIGPALGAAAASAVGIMTGIQVGLISRQKEPVQTAFADGGFVNNPGDGINAIVGEAGPEAILPLTDATFQALADSIVDAQQGDTDGTGSNGLGNLTVIIEGLGEANIPITQDALDNGQLRVAASSIVQGV